MLEKYAAAAQQDRPAHPSSTTKDSHMNVLKLAHTRKIQQLQWFLFFSTVKVKLMLPRLFLPVSNIMI